MTSSFKVKEKVIDKLFSGMHRGDNTMRPQILKRELNIEYYDLINKFYQKTGLPLILNTSLNLHRKPMATDIKDIFDIIKNSNLDGIIINKKFLIIENEN